MNGGKEYKFNMNSEQLRGLILMDGKELKNKLVRINDVMIIPTNISSLEFISTHTPPIKFNGIFRSYKKVSIMDAFSLLY